MNTANKMIHKMSLTGMMMALVFLGAYAIKIPTPLNGYIHIGDAFVLLSGLILGPIYGALAASIGSALADIFGNYVPWAFPTFIIKGSMAAIMGFIALKKDNIKVIFMATSLFSVIWFGFNYLLKYILTKEVTVDSLDIASELNLNTTELVQMSSKMQNNLLYLALCIPIILALIFLSMNKFSKYKFPLAYSIGFIISGAIMILGYYIATYFMYGSYILPIFEIPMNILQFVVGIVIAHILLPIVQKLIISKMQIQ